MTASLWLAGFFSVFDDQYVLLYKATQTLHRNRFMQFGPELAQWEL
jgi:uncharacterized protein YhbP (UPF0306 family)